MYRYRKANEAVRAPDGLKQHTAAMNAKRPLRLPRAALIAACLCLALVGTAFAASVLSGRVNIKNVTILERKDTYGGVTPITVYTVEADGLARVPLESISREARDFCASFTRMPQYKEFDSWEEAEQFLGLEIANNPLLEQAEYYVGELHDTYGRDYSANCLVEFEGYFDVPTMITLSAGYLSVGEDGYGLSVHTFFTTDQGDPDSNPPTYSRSRQHYVSPNDSVVFEEYASPNGLEAVIITTDRAHGYPSSYAAYSVDCEFVLNGVSFWLSTSSHWYDDGPDEAIAFIKQVVDAYS